MKVLVVVEGMWPPVIYMTGASALYDLQKHLCKLGVDIHILTTIEKHTDIRWKEWFKSEEKEENIHFHYIDLRILKNIPKLHFYISKIALFFCVIKLNFKYNFDIIHEYSSTPILFIRTGIYKRFFKVKTIHTLSTYNTKMNYELFRIFKKITSSLNRIICTTYHMEKALKVGYPKNRIEYIPLGIDLAKFKVELNSVSLRNKLNVFSKSKMVLYVGLIEERKGIFTFLKSMPIVLSEHPDTIFVIASYPIKGVFYDYYKNRDKLLNFIKDCKENFRLLEDLQDIPLLMSATDVFVLPLTTPHGTLGYPLTLLEAMASGKAIAASDILGINELIVDGKNGLLFQKGDHKALANAINLLLSNEKLRKKLGENAKQDIKEYDLNTAGKRLKEKYIEVCDASQ